MQHYHYVTGKELIDVFISHADKKPDREEEESDFKEPAELDGKLRWQIIRLIPAKSKSPSSVGEVKDTHPPSRVDGAGHPDYKKTASAGDSDQPGECNEELEDLVKKEIDVSFKEHNKDFGVKMIVIMLLFQ